MDAIDFEYPDYERLDKGAEGQKRKRVASTLIKDDEDQPKTKKEKFEPKVIAPRKRKAASPKPVSPEPKRLVRDEEIPATPSAAEVEEILKVMQETHKNGHYFLIKLIILPFPQILSLKLVHLH